MAIFTVDPQDPSFVIDQNGRSVPASLIDPSLIQQSASPAAPLAPQPGITPAPGSQLATGTQGKTPKVVSLLDNVYGVTSNLNSRPAVVKTGSQSTTSVQKGVDPSVLNPILESNTKTANEQATMTEQLGSERSKRAADTAMSDSTAAYGRYAESVANRERDQQNAEIARKNALATSLQQDPEIDPDRYVRNMSTGQQIGMVILTALNGGFKGLVGQSGNDVLDILDRQIRADVDAQKEQIQSGRIRRGNLVQYFTNEGMRLDQAAKAAEAVSWAMLDRMQDSERARMNSPEAEENAKLLGSQIRSQAEQRNNELKLSLGTDRVNTQNTSTYAYTDGSSSGKDTAFDNLKKFQAFAEQASAEEKGNIVAKALGKDTIATPDLVKKWDDSAKDIAKDMNELAPVQSDIKTLVETAGGTIDMKTGKISFPKDLKGVGPVDNVTGMSPTLGFYETNKDKIEAAQKVLKERVTTQITGANSSIKQDDTFTQMAGGGLGNEEAFKRNLQNFSNTVWAQQRNIMSRSPEGAALYRHSLGNENRAANGNVRAE